jgi:hypothetical protein
VSDKTLFEANYAELELRVLGHLWGMDKTHVKREFEQFRERLDIPEGGSVTGRWTHDKPPGHIEEVPKSYSASYPYLSLARLLGVDYGRVLLAADALEQFGYGGAVGGLAAFDGMSPSLLTAVDQRMHLERYRREQAVLQKEKANAG